MMYSADFALCSVLIISNASSINPQLDWNILSWSQIHQLVKKH